MIKQKIAYVDEVKGEIRTFQRKFADDFDVIGLLPEENMNDLIENIFKQGVKAVITDFNLAEYKTTIKYHVPYDGVKLVESIRQIRQGFPCFVLTSYDGNAIQESGDVNMIYPKDALNQKFGNTTLQEKVNVQIKHYVALLENSTAEFNSLLKKREDSELTEKEEGRLLELDTLLENSINGKKAIPKSAKESIGIKKLNALLESTDNLIKALGKEKRK